MILKTHVRGDSIEIRGPLMILHPDRLEERIGNETLVVSGASRGRTTIASFTLYNLGYFLGDRISETNLEDLDFLDAIPEPKAGPGKITESAATRDLIARRNAEHARWGFKLPRLTSQIPEIEPLLRNPVFMVCLRNPISVARTILRREEGAHKAAFSKLINHGLQPFIALQTIMESVSSPVIMADMDEAYSHPVAFVKQVAGLLRLDGPIEEIAKNISVPGYKKKLLSDGQLKHIAHEKNVAAQNSVVRPGKGVLRSDQ